MSLFPESTIFNRIIPKEKFYTELHINNKGKQLFVEQINKIIWANKLSANTLNMDKGKEVEEIEVFRIELKATTLDTKILKLLDTDMPRHILFLLSNNGKIQVWIAYKEKDGSHKHRFTVKQYYHTEWIAEEALKLPICGLNMDQLYEHLVRHISGGVLGDFGEKTIAISVENDLKRQEIEKQIEKLNKRLNREVQLKFQMEISNQIRRLKKELETL